MPWKKHPLTVVHGEASELLNSKGREWSVRGVAACGRMVKTSAVALGSQHMRDLSLRSSLRRAKSPKSAGGLVCLKNHVALCSPAMNLFR